MVMGFAPTWLRQVSPPLLHKTTLTTGIDRECRRLHRSIGIRIPFHSHKEVQAKYLTPVATFIIKFGTLIHLQGVDVL